MTDREEMIDVATTLERVRDGLLVAITEDRRRSRHRRRVRVTGVIVAGVLASGTAVAASTGLFSSAPDNVKDVFDQLNGQGGPAVDASQAIEIGSIDDHAAYAVPTEDGGYCLYFAPDERSGPNGTACTALLQPVGSGEIVITPLLGGDGGFAFGRVGTDSATTVDIELPDGVGVISTPVGQEGFFLVAVPEAAMPALWQLETLSATATDAQGAVVAISTPDLEQTMPGIAPASPTP